MDTNEISRIEKAMRRFVSSCREGSGNVGPLTAEQAAAAYATFESAVEGFANDLRAIVLR